MWISLIIFVVVLALNEFLRPRLKWEEPGEVIQDAVWSKHTNHDTYPGEYLDRQNPYRFDD